MASLLGTAAPRPGDGRYWFRAASPNRRDRIIENLKAVCEAGGTSLDNAVKVTIFMEDLADLGEMNAVFEEYFGTENPSGANDVSGGENHRGREARNRTARVHPPVIAPNTPNI